LITEWACIAIVFSEVTIERLISRSFVATQAIKSSPLSLKNVELWRADSRYKRQ
jgi:hypothetical protein